MILHFSMMMMSCYYYFYHYYYYSYHFYHNYYSYPLRLLFPLHLSPLFPPLSPQQ